MRVVDIEKEEQMCSILGLQEVQGSGVEFLGEDVEGEV